MDVGIRGIVPVHPDLTIAPMHVRDVANRSARARTESPVLEVKMGMGLIPELEAVEESLEEGLGFETHLLDLVGREVFEFFIGFLAVPDPDGIGLGGFTVGLDGVQVFRVDRSLDAGSAHGGDDLIGGDSFENHDQEVKAFRTGRDHQAGEVRLDAEVLEVKIGPAAEGGADVGSHRDGNAGFRREEMVGEVFPIFDDLKNIRDLLDVSLAISDVTVNDMPKIVHPDSLVVSGDHTAPPYNSARFGRANFKPLLGSARHR